MIAQHYQGNMWWIGAGLFSLFMLSQILWGAWRKRKVGMPVDVQAIVGLGLICLIFLAFAILQVLTHEK
jgi:hypothetical protein